MYLRNFKSGVRIIMNKDKGKRLLTELGRKRVSSYEMFAIMSGEGFTREDIRELLSDLIRDQLGTNKGQTPDMDSIRMAVKAMIIDMVAPEKVWTYLEEFGVPPKMRLKLVQDLHDELLGATKVTEIICTMCGHDCSKLTSKERKCPTCSYHMIKIFRDLRIKNGQSKERVIELICKSDTFTKEEKDMIK